MPAPEGFTTSEKNAFMEQRKDAMTAKTNNQREMAKRLSALRFGSITLNSNNNSIISGPGTPHSSPTSSISSSSGPLLPSFRPPQIYNENSMVNRNCIGDTLIRNDVIAGVFKTGLPSEPVNHPMQLLPDGVCRKGVIGGNDNGRFAMGKNISNSIDYQEKNINELTKKKICGRRKYI